MGYRLDKAKELIQQLTETERQELDKHLLGIIETDAIARLRETRLVLASDYLEAALKMQKEWGKIQGIRSGYPSIDKFSKGFVGGEVIVIGGATSNGKTSLAVNITARVAKTGKSVLFVTLEMTKEQLTSRLLQAVSNFEDYAAMVAYQQNDEMNWKSIDALIGAAVEKMNVDLVVIDHLHYFSREIQNTAEDLGRITKEFKKNAIRHDVPIILISHTRKGDGNTIDDLRGSSYIAQDADIVLMVHRDKQYPDKIAVSIHKNRNRGFDPNDDTVMLDFDKTRIMESHEWNQ